MMRGLIILLTICISMPLAAENLYKPGNWPALASDRRAGQIGDIISVIVSENDQASNTVRKGSKKRSSVNGQIVAENALNESAGVNFGGSYNGQGENARADRMLAQLSVTVSNVLPNGDMMVTGSQNLKINGEQTLIKVSGRIRREDISSQNSIMSSRLADAVIDYDGKGFATRSAKPGIVTQIFSWLGLL
jgi:flagellar L-ring protein FlgH